MIERNPMPARQLGGEEPFHDSGNALPFTVREFWRWSMSDLVGNAVRGVLAEYLVARALRCVDSIRTEWDACDLTMPSGIRVEVKASGYLQSWAQRTESTPSFDIGTKRAWHAETNTYSPTPCRSADVYVFALHAHHDRNTIDPLDISQWEFYVVPTSVLNQHCPTQKRIGLSGIRRLSGMPVTFHRLAETVLARESLVSVDTGKTGSR
jgi:hypothetical protein